MNVINLFKLLEAIPRLFLSESFDSPGSLQMYQICWSKMLSVTQVQTAAQLWQEDTLQSLFSAEV